MNTQGKERMPHMRYIRRNDPAYPAQLRPYDRMPDGLYVIGALPDPAVRSVAIVGARSCSNYGRSEAIRFGEVLASHGVQIISGLALGCDAAGHEGALRGGGLTFAVLGSGADVCHPRANRQLYEAIPAAGGGILSEFEPGTPAIGWHFPVRNRIISALSDIVLVVEARRRSGSLITVAYALEQGKTVFAIPGRNRDGTSEGCNYLIAQGAGIATDPADLLAELGIAAHEREEARSRQAGGSDAHASEGKPGRRTGGSDAHASERKPGRRTGGSAVHAAGHAVLGALDFDEQDVRTIAARAGCTEAEAVASLLELCAAGAAREVLPGYFCRS